MTTLPDTQNTNQIIAHHIKNFSLTGCNFTIDLIETYYTDLQKISDESGENILNNLQKGETQSEDDFNNYLDLLRKNAFRLTISITGKDGIVVYGEDVSVFRSTKIRYPIERIFFTNATAYKRFANGENPENLIEVVLDFSEQPILDPYNIVSAPSPNQSNAAFNCRNSSFFEACKSITKDFIHKSKSSWSFLHTAFSYDLILWTFFAPYALYYISVYSKFFSEKIGNDTLFWPAAFIYLSVVSIFVFRITIGYAKRVFPVASLAENKGVPFKHRAILAAIILGLVVNGLSKYIF